MNRREFLKEMGLWTAGLIAAQPILRISRALAQEPAKSAAQSSLSVGVGENYVELVEKVLAPLGGIKAFVKKDHKVVIKPNIGWDRKPEQAATTHPLVVKALVRQALDAGAAKVMVFDRTCNDERRCYENSGIKEAVESIDDKRVEISFIDERKFVPVKIAKGKLLTEWDLYKDALEADCYINVPIAKQHGISGLTLGLKNIMGVMGSNRGKIHRSIGQALADLTTVLKPHLTVIDATRILLRNGPVGGSLDDVKVLHTILASTDPITADAYATTLFGLSEDHLETTRAGSEIGLGEMNLKKVNIIKATA